MLPVLLATAALGRPATLDFVDGEAGVRCHWANAVDEPLCVDLIGYLARARDEQVGRLGWPAPRPDGGRGGSDSFDVYLVYSDGWTGAYDMRCDEDEGGACIDVDPGDGLAGASAYALIDPRVERRPLETITHRVYAEAVLLGIDHAQPFAAVRAGTAAWLAQQGLDDPSWLLAPIADYQAAPWASALLSDSASLHALDGRWTDYDTGAVVWAYEVGPEDLLALWLDGSSEGGGTEPDVLDAWAPSDATLLELALARARIGNARAPEWAQFLGSAGFAHREASLWGTGETVVPEHAPLPLGAVYVDVYLLAGESLLVEVESDAPTRWGVLVTEHQARLSASAVGKRIEHVAVSDGIVTVGALNLGPAGFDADDPLLGAPVRLHVRTPLDAPDPVEVCGCATGAGSGTWLGPLLVLLCRRRSR